MKILKAIIMLVGITSLIDVATTLYGGGEFRDSIGDLIFGIGMLCIYFVKIKKED